MNQDLKQRIPIAIIYVLTIVAAMFAGQSVACILMIIFYFLSVHEFMTRGGQRSVSAPRITALTLAPMIFMLILFKNGVISIKLMQFLATLSSFILLSNAIYLIKNKRSLLLSLSSYIGAAWYLVLPFLLTLIALLTISDFSLTLLGIFIIIWVNDTGAYFTGRAFGKHKIAPSISPGKSWEGWCGGTIISILIAIAIAKLMPQHNQFSWIVIAAIVSVTGVIGDLTESSWKRNLKIKDSGTILQGHGGFLDRLDSFIYSIPFILLYLTSINL